ncbi:hypothetical protein HK096_004253 [Nowakowskiella sp. JEL0078]|nr:hypothetical protein HK096_004253 [Nowakowskiella sp. JEL0078]
MESLHKENIDTPIRGQPILLNKTTLKALDQPRTTSKSEFLKTISQNTPKKLANLLGGKTPGIKDNTVKPSRLLAQSIQTDIIAPTFETPRVAASSALSMNLESFSNRIIIDDTDEIESMYPDLEKMEIEAVGQYFQDCVFEDKVITEITYPTVDAFIPRSVLAKLRQGEDRLLRFNADEFDFEPRTDDDTDWGDLEFRVKFVDEELLMFDNPFALAF